jgi:putative ABC transport system ATP-binding protein
MVIQIKNISKTYEGEIGCQALKDVSLDIKKGEFLAIVGPSGSGKSTLLNAIAGLDIPQEGKVVIDGMSIYEITEDQRSVFRREYIGLIFQQYHLIPILTAEENVLVPLVFSKNKDKLAMVKEILKKMGLEDKEKNIPGQLSGGQCQRVAIARALINKPVIILADEPTGNLDSKTGKHIMDLLKQLNKEGQTIIMVTHDLNCAKYANKVIHLEDGKIRKIEYTKFGGIENGR